MSAPSSSGGRVARLLLNSYAALALLYLFTPIIWIVAFSFNKPKGNYNVEWQRFTLDNWADPFGDESLTNAFVESLKIAGISTVVATVLGSMNLTIAFLAYNDSHVSNCGGNFAITDTQASSRGRLAHITLHLR